VLEVCVAAYFLPRLPDQIPNYVNSRGKLLIFGSKWLIFLYPAINLVMLGFMYFPFRFDSLRKNLLRSVKPVILCYIAVTVILALGFVDLIRQSMQIQSLYTVKITVVLLSMSMIVAGNIMPIMKRSWFSGIPTPWAMKNDEIWLLTQRFAGWVLIIIGIYVLFMPMLPIASPSKMIIAIAIVGYILINIFSYVVYKNSQKDT
jgi:uncharacterized membrane protein